MSCKDMIEIYLDGLWQEIENYSPCQYFKQCVIILKKLYFFQKQGKYSFVWHNLISRIDFNISNVINNY